MSARSSRPTQRDQQRIAVEDPLIDWPALEDLLRADPAARGLALLGRKQSAAGAGHLRNAALDLARRATAVGIVTGFPVESAGRITAETDGPPGALFLAQALLAAGADVWLISDSYGLPLLRAGCEQANLDFDPLIEFPFDPHGSRCDAWVDDFFARGAGSRLTHLVAIERPGPSHTLESLERQPRGGPTPRERFLASVPPRDRDVCHNMRGESIDALVPPTHALFDWIGRHRLPITTIGLGDGGNEIGMGCLAWEEIVEAVGSGPTARIACRIATDFLIVGGVSDWAAYALALAVARLLGLGEPARLWTAESQRQLIVRMVEAGAVDGLTRRHEATVDGLPLDVYLEPLVAMRKLLGFQR